MIVSSFIYVSLGWAIKYSILKVLTTPQYYDSENISKSKLSFRRATCEPAPDPDYSVNVAYMKALYDMDRCVTHHQRLLNPVS